MPETERKTTPAAHRSTGGRLICAGDLPLLHAFALALWQERARERCEPVPACLANSCKFTALFVQALAGGTIRGNWQHVHVRLDSGSIVDLNSDAMDVRRLKLSGIDPYRHDRRFIASRDFKMSLASCNARVKAWVADLKNQRATSWAEELKALQRPMLGPNEHT